MCLSDGIGSIVAGLRFPEVMFKLESAYGTVTIFWFYDKGNTGY